MLVVECCLLLKVNVTLTSCLNSLKIVSPTLFEVEISNFVCGCILILEIAAYYFGSL